MARPRKTPDDPSTAAPRGAAASHPRPPKLAAPKPPRAARPKPAKLQIQPPPKRRARPLAGAARVQVTLGPAEIAWLDAFAAEHSPPIASRAEAIRRALMLARAATRAPRS